MTLFLDFISLSSFMFSIIVGLFIVFKIIKLI